MKPLVIAHRGFSGQFPENSLPAIRAAIRLGVDFVEIDVQETADGKLIVFHDYRLNRICGVPGRVCDTTAARLRRLHPAVPTLAEVLRTCRGKTRVLIEIKRADPAKVAALIRRHRMEQQVIVFTFSKRRLAELAAAAPALPRFAPPSSPRLEQPASVSAWSRCQLPAAAVETDGGATAPARLASFCVDRESIRRDAPAHWLGRGRIDY